MNYTLYDNSAALIAASEARHAGGSHALSDAHAEMRRREVAYSAERAAYKADSNPINGERLEVAHRLLILGRRAVVALGGEA